MASSVCDKSPVDYLSVDDYDKGMVLTRYHQVILDFVIDKNRKSDEKRFKDLEIASNSSTDFWDNDIDDKVWNDV